jgi:hypothetical protein
MVNPRTSLISRYIVDDLSWEKYGILFSVVTKELQKLEPSVVDKGSMGI